MSLHNFVRSVSFFSFVVFFGGVCFATSVWAEDSLPPLALPVIPNIENLSPEIQTILKKDPNVLTDEEKQKIIPIFTANSSITQSLVPIPKDTVNCFDYYHFGSVQVDVSSLVPSTVPGAPITFKGKLRNNNSYPIVDGQVYVKIFKKEGEESLTSQDGYPVIDQFFAAEGISLPAQGAKDIVFTWQVPASALSGDYEIAAFFMTAKRFNLLGLAFTDDVTGNKTDFSIASGKTNGVQFDKHAVTLNDTQYRFAIFPPHFMKNEPVKAEVRLQNTTNEPQTVQITWTLSNWAGERDENRIDQKVETITLKENETKSLSYTTTKAIGSVSFLNVEAGYKDTKSILNIRWVRDGFDEVRINFPSVLKYPLAKGESNTLFSCLHSTTSPIVDGGELLLTLKDMEGNIIHSYTYSGGITSTMMGIKDDFTTKETFVDFMLTATLKNKGRVVEEVTERYSCQDIDPSQCPKGYWGVIVAVCGGVLLLGLLWWKLWNRKSAQRAGMMSLVLGLLLSGVMLFGLSETTEAAGPLPRNASWSSGTLMADYAAGRDNPEGAGMQFTTSVVYRGALLSRSQYVDNDAPISVDEHFNIRVLQGHNDISYFGAGGVYDSPFGRWGDTLKSCHASQVSCPMINRTPYVIYTADLTVEASSVDIASVTSNVNCTKTGRILWMADTYRTDFDCVVTGTGSVEVTVEVDPATVRVATAAWWYYGLLYYHNPGPITTVPAQTLGFYLIANADNANPDKPAVWPLPGNTNSPNESQSFGLRATDPNGDTLHYGIDWDKNGSVDQWEPSSGYVSSGTTQSVSKIWNATGRYDFQVLTQDSKGGDSGWTPHTIVLAPVVTFTGDPLTINAGENVTLEWSMNSGGGHCAGYAWPPANGDWKWDATNQPPSGTSVVPLTQTTTFALDCWDGGGIPADRQFVNVSVFPETTFTADPLIIDAGDRVELQWSMTSWGGHCVGYAWPSVNDDWYWDGGNIRATSGFDWIMNLTETTTFALDCWDGDGLPAERQSVTVTALRPEVTMLLNGASQDIRVPSDNTPFTLQITGTNNPQQCYMKAVNSLGQNDYYQSFWCGEYTTPQTVRPGDWPFFFQDGVNTIQVYMENSYGVASDEVAHTVGIGTFRPSVSFLLNGLPQDLVLGTATSTFDYLVSFIDDPTSCFWSEQPPGQPWSPYFPVSPFECVVQKGYDERGISPAMRGLQTGINGIRYYVSNSAGISDVVTRYITVPPPVVNTLALCTESGLTPIATGTATRSRNLYTNASEGFRAFYDSDPTDCAAGTGIEVTTGWAEPVASSVVSISGNGTTPQVITAGSNPGTENVTLTQGTDTITLDYTIHLLCIPNCSNASNVCAGTVFSASNCGSNNCTGTKNCNYNFRESSP